MRGKHLPLRNSQHPVFPLRWLKLWVHNESTVTQKVKDLKIKQRWKIRHIRFFSLWRAPLGQSFPLQNDILPPVLWCWHRNTDGGFTRIRSGQQRTQGVQLQSMFLCLRWKQRYHRSSSRMTAEAQGSESTLWSSSASSDKGNTGNSWQSRCQCTNPPAQPQHRTETGKVHCQASAR